VRIVVTRHLTLDRIRTLKQRIDTANDLVLLGLRSGKGCVD
jgi:hypothetical protein